MTDLYLSPTSTASPPSYIQYAKDEDTPDNVYIRITAYNRGPDPATLHIIPQLWFPNFWSWPLPTPKKPKMSATGENRITAVHESLGKVHLYCLPSPPPVGPNGEPVPSGTGTRAEGGDAVEGEEGGEEDVEGEEEEGESVEPELLFTENNTNFKRLWGVPNETEFVKDAFHDHIIPNHRPPGQKLANGHFQTEGADRGEAASGQPSNGHANANGGGTGEDGSPEGSERSTPTPNGNARGGGFNFVNPEKKGTKAAAHYTFANVPGNGGCAVVRLKLVPSSFSASTSTSTSSSAPSSVSASGPESDPTLEDEGLFDDAMEERRQEADEFYGKLVLGPVSDDLKAIMRQAMGGMMWTKQYYRFVCEEWLNGDKAQPPPPWERKEKTPNKVRWLFSLDLRERRLMGLCVALETFACGGYSFHAG